MSIFYTDLDKIDELFEPYKEIILIIDHYLDDLVHKLNKLKLIDPDKKICDQTNEEYKEIIKNYYKKLKKVEITEHVVVIKKDNSAKGILTAEFRVNALGHYILYSKMGEYSQDSMISTTLNHCKDVFDACVEIRKSIENLVQLGRKVSSYKCQLIKIKGELFQQV